MPTDPSTTTARTLDDNIVRLEDDLVFVELHGRMSVAAAEALAEIYESTIKRHGYILILIDIEESVLIGADPKARRILVDWNKQYSRKLAAAAFGGSAAVRVMLTLMNNAVRVLSGHAQPFQTFKTEAQARTFLAAQRARLRR